MREKARRVRKINNKNSGLPNLLRRSHAISSDQLLNKKIVSSFYERSKIYNIIKIINCIAFQASGFWEGNPCWKSSQIEKEVK